MLMIITIASDITKKETKSPTINHNNNMKITTNKCLSVWQTQEHWTQPPTSTTNRWYNPRFKIYYWNGTQPTTVWCKTQLRWLLNQTQPTLPKHQQTKHNQQVTPNIQYNRVIKFGTWLLVV